jgi:hypothetical protein
MVAWHRQQSDCSSSERRPWTWWTSVAGAPQPAQAGNAASCAARVADQPGGIGSLRANDGWRCASHQPSGPAYSGHQRFRHERTSGMAQPRRPLPRYRSKAT